MYCRLNLSAIFLGFMIKHNALVVRLFGWICYALYGVPECLGSWSTQRCSSHFFFLWSQTWILISLFKSFILLSAGFSFLMRSLSSTSRAVSVDMTLSTAGILQQGMLFLAAFIFTFLRNLLCEKTSSDEGGEDVASSICCVKFGQ